MPYQVLARKYRPKQFSDVVGQPHVVRALSNALNQGMLHHAYLFTGTRGSGKTTTARILVKCLSCEKGITAEPCDQCAHCHEIDAGCFPDFFEVDAASRTKVEDTRELLDNVPYATSKGRFKIYLIDEVHMLSGHSFNALLKTLEEPPEHVKFLLATTDHQKLPATILSRCLQFHLQQTSPQQIADHLANILHKENIPFDFTALKHIGKAANGSLRDALSLLDQCIAFGNNSVKEADVKTLLGTIEPTALLEIAQALSEKNGLVLRECVEKLNLQGVNFAHALSELLSLLHKISVLQLVPEAEIENNSPTLQILAKTLTPEDTQLFYQIAILGQRDFAYAPSPSIAFEMTLLRMLAFYPNSAAKPIATTPTAAPKTTASEKNLDWSNIISKLSLTGAALALAQNCTLQKIADSTLYLLIKQSQKPLAQPNQIQRIREALSNYWQRPVNIIVQVGEHEQQTPAEQMKEHQQQRHQNTKQKLTEDLKLQQLMQTFDATLIEDSIKTDHSH